MNKYIEALKGITYLEWSKLKNAVDRTFYNESNERLQWSRLKDLDTVERNVEDDGGWPSPERIREKAGD